MPIGSSRGTGPQHCILIKKDPLREQDMTPCSCMIAKSYRVVYILIKSWGGLFFIMDFGECLNPILQNTEES